MSLRILYRIPCCSKSRRHKRCSLSVLLLFPLVLYYYYFYLHKGSTSPSHPIKAYASLPPDKGSTPPYHPIRAYTPIPLLRPVLDLTQINRFCFRLDVKPVENRSGPIQCGEADDWIDVKDGLVRITPAARQKHGQITCRITHLVRKGDFTVDRDTKLHTLSHEDRDGFLLERDFFRASCKSTKGEKYDHLHAAVAYDRAIHHRLDKAAEARRVKRRASEDGGGGKAGARGDVSLDGQRPLSVLILGLDSMSHVAWRQYLPRTRRYCVDQLGGIELQHYNVMGDGTPAALLPILLGKSEVELPEVRRGFPGATTLDHFPWIMKNFSSQGYVTAFAEDAPDINTFQLRLLGFREKPADHYMRPFYFEAANEYGRYKNYCFRSKPRHVIFLDWLRHLFDMYKEFPKFFFGFHNELTHYRNHLASAMDDDIFQFLDGLEQAGHLNHTLLVLMADHGARYGTNWLEGQGRLEERLPYLMLRLPAWFRRQRPELVSGLLANTQRLTTPFDLHQILLDVVRLAATGTVQGIALGTSNARWTTADLDTNKGLSFFREIPASRSCSHAHIPPHWCACLHWQPVSQSEPQVAKFVEIILVRINRKTRPQRQKCAELTLSAFKSSARYVCNPVDQQEQSRLDNYWTGKYAKMFARKPELTCNPGTELYQVSFTVEPSKAHFEVVCTLNVTSGNFHVEDTDISRVNEYGNQASCIARRYPLLTLFCFCV